MGIGNITWVSAFATETRRHGKFPRGPVGGIKIGAVGTHTNALELVVYDEKGQPFTVKYHEMAPMLLNEMKKQQHTIAGQADRIAAQQQENRAQQAQIEALRHEQQREVAVLEIRLARLETRK